MIRGIVLAAGFGRRVGTPKALLETPSGTFHERAVRTLREAGLGVTVIVNAGIVDALPTMTAGEERIVNPDPDQVAGMFGSVKLGVNSAIVLGASGVILLPVDHPLVTSDDVSRVAEALRAGAAVVVPAHEGRRGHPIGLSRAVMEEMTADTSIETLRDVVRRDPTRVVEVEGSPGTRLGVNTKEDLERVSNRTFR